VDETSQVRLFAIERNIFRCIAKRTRSPAGVSGPERGEGVGQSRRPNNPSLSCTRNDLTPSCVNPTPESSTRKLNPFQPPHPTPETSTSKLIPHPKPNALIHHQETDSSHANSILIHQSHFQPPIPSCIVTNTHRREHCHLYTRAVQPGLPTQHPSNRRLYPQRHLCGPL
jgi:hypothetical protein